MILRKVKRLFSAFVILLFPSFVATRILRLIGHRIDKGCKLGFSCILTDRLLLKKGARIGHLNFIKTTSLLMWENATIGRMNIMHGPVDILIGRASIIGNANKVVRGPQGEVSVGRATLKLGKLSSFTAGHRIDCTRSVRLGNYTTVAGVGTQIWTHGYIHDLTGPGRYRIDGEVNIGSNVYVGASCVFSMGVTIGEGVIIGAGTNVGKSILEAGLYFSSVLRKLPRPINPDLRPDLLLQTDKQLCERVYLKMVPNADE